MMYHENFKAKKMLDSTVVKRVKMPVKASSSCLWAALLEAFADAEIRDVAGRIDDASKIKDQCLSYMRIKPDDNKRGAGQMTEEQKKNLYKPEFRGHTCINQNSLGILR
jgi:hypothetical protein